jgi:hypothetical protein
MKISMARLIWEVIRDDFKRLFCTHDWRFEQELSGDIRNLVGGRYEWRCRKCNKAKFTDTL